MPSYVQEYFGFYIDAFMELSSCRTTGNSPIPFTAIVEYTKMVDVEDFEEFLFVIRQMDSKLMELDGKSNNNKTNKHKGKR